MGAWREEVAKRRAEKEAEKERLKAERAAHLEKVLYYFFIIFTFLSCSRPHSLRFVIQWLTNKTNVVFFLLLGDQWMASREWATTRIESSIPNGAWSGSQFNQSLNHSIIQSIQSINQSIILSILYMTQISSFIFTLYNTCAYCCFYFVLIRFMQKRVQNFSVLWRKKWINGSKLPMKPSMSFSLPLFRCWIISFEKNNLMTL
jgi:hypothetical protein